MGAGPPSFSRCLRPLREAYELFFSVFCSLDFFIHNLSSLERGVAPTRPFGHFSCASDKGTRIELGDLVRRCFFFLPFFRTPKENFAGSTVDVSPRLTAFDRAGIVA